MDTRNELVDVFLCHNGADKEWVRNLAEQIESETFDGHLNGRPLRVFFDEWDDPLVAGIGWVPELVASTSSLIVGTRAQPRTVL